MVIEIETWEDKVTKYKKFCGEIGKGRTWEILRSLEPLGTDFYKVPLIKRRKAPLRRAENPELLMGLKRDRRRGELNFIALILSEFVDLGGSYASKIPLYKGPKLRFGFKSYMVNLLLISHVSERNGQCEYLISFALLSNRSTMSRKLDGGFWGPRYALRWPFNYTGASLRRFVISAFL
jgi:hypothetical protein